MARTKRRPKVTVEVIWRADGTALRDVYQARHAVSTVFEGGRAIVHLDGGWDDEGPVSGATYRRVDRIKHRPARKRGKR